MKTQLYLTSTPQPSERENKGVTFNEIKDGVRELNPSASPEELQAMSLLLAILKQGSSIQKLQWFTGYKREFLSEHIEWLRSRGLLFTGNLSPKFILSEVPGSGELIERITGQRVIVEQPEEPVRREIVRNRVVIAEPAQEVDQIEIDPEPEQAATEETRKENPDMKQIDNGHAGPEEADEEAAHTCIKTELCDKPDGHTGRCKGPQPRQRLRRQPATAKAAQKVKEAMPKSVQPNVAKTTVTAITSAAPSHFKIEYEDEDLTINIEGIGRDSFAAAVKVAGSLAGGSNG